MVANILLKLDGVEGESKVAGHEGDIDLLSASLGAMNQSSVRIGTGAGTSKVSIDHFTFTKRVDAASPDLFVKLTTGQHYGKAVILFYKAGGNNNVQVKYLEYEIA